MTSSGGCGRVTGPVPGESTAESGSAADTSHLLWVVGLVAIVLSVAAFVLWARHGAALPAT